MEQIESKRGEKERDWNIWKNELGEKKANKSDYVKGCFALFYVYKFIHIHNINLCTYLKIGSVLDSPFCLSYSLVSVQRIKCQQHEYVLCCWCEDRRTVVEQQVVRTTMRADDQGIQARAKEYNIKKIRFRVVNCSSGFTLKQPLNDPGFKFQICLIVCKFILDE